METKRSLPELCTVSSLTGDGLRLASHMFKSGVGWLKGPAHACVNGEKALLQPETHVWAAFKVHSEALHAKSSTTEVKMPVE